MTVRLIRAKLMVGSPRRLRNVWIVGRGTLRSDDSYIARFGGVVYQDEASAWASLDSKA